MVAHCFMNIVSLYPKKIKSFLKYFQYFFPVIWNMQEFYVSFMEISGFQLDKMWDIGQIVEK